MKKMSTIGIVSMFVLACLVSILYRYIYSSEKPAPLLNNKSVPISNIVAQVAVKNLTDLGYYKYADSKDMDTLKEELANSLEKYQTISTVYADNVIIPLDYRYFLFDGETIFEQGGFTDIMKDMSKAFEKMGLKMEVTNHVENATSKTLHHELTVNGKRYVIFENFDGYGWGEAAQRYAEMLNDQLKLQNKDERLYLINGGNDGTAIFLTDKQVQFIDKLLKDNQWKPLKTKDWCRVFKVKPLCFD